MKLIHTGDWHLGKSIDAYSRLDEQKLFIEEFINIVRTEKIDIVLIAGDIFDTYTPPAEAQHLFNYAIKELSENGKRCVVVISGNHDSPERLDSIKPFAEENGILIFGMPNTKTEIKKYQNFEIIESGNNFFEISLNNEKAIIVTLPYPSENRLRESIINSLDEDKIQNTYSDKIKTIIFEASSKFREDTVNIIVSHLFTLGGMTSDSERSIEVGGMYLVNPDAFPDNAHYIALGHLHKPQKVGNIKNGYYSGSPIQYSLNEISTPKSVKIIEVSAGQEPVVENILLTNHKPLEEWRCDSVDEALQRCSETKDANSLVYIIIKTDKPITHDEIKSIKSSRKGIVEIILEYTYEEENNQEKKSLSEYSDSELFREFFIFKKNVEPTDELIQNFLELLETEGDKDETADS